MVKIFQQQAAAPRCDWFTAPSRAFNEFGQHRRDFNWGLNWKKAARTWWENEVDTQAQPRFVVFNESSAAATHRHFSLTDDDASIDGTSQKREGATRYLPSTKLIQFRAADWAAFIISRRRCCSRRREFGIRRSMRSLDKKGIAKNYSSCKTMRAGKWENAPTVAQHHSIIL